MTSSTTPLNDRYPIGLPDRVAAPEDRASAIAAIRNLPHAFSSAYRDLVADQLDTPYRDGGWTLRQLAHHVADSHMNAFLRLKLALTTEWPAIVPYDEKRWAETREVRGPVEEPLALLGPLHARMAALLDSLTPAEWERGYLHPESGPTTLSQFAALYGWHGRHHTAHVLALRRRKGW